MNDNITRLRQFLDLRGFKELEQHKTHESFGDYFVIFSSPFFDVRTSSSRSFEIIDIRSATDISNWFDLALIKALICGETKLNQPPSMTVLIPFLIENYTVIRDLFSSDQYPDTRKKLEQLEKLRTAQMFPDLN